MNLSTAASLLIHSVNSAMWILRLERSLKVKYFVYYFLTKITTKIPHFPNLLHQGPLCVFDCVTLPFLKAIRLSLWFIMNYTPIVNFGKATLHPVACVSARASDKQLTRADKPVCSLHCSITSSLNRPTLLYRKVIYQDMKAQKLHLNFDF